MGKQLERSDRWRGSHRGIGIEVQRHDRPMFGSSFEKPVGKYDQWNYYLYVGEKQVPEAKWPRFFLEPRIEPITPGGRAWLRYDYYESALGELDSWHGGITYYEYACSVPGFRAVCAGCDYLHAWDNAESNPFSLAYVEAEARRTVDELWTRHPDLLVHCGWTGKYAPVSEMEPWGDGWISAEGRQKRDAEKEPK